MAKIISFGNQKGGVGKTTLTVICANALANLPFSKKVLVIDNDQQKSIVNLRAFDEEDIEPFIAPYPVQFMSYKDILKNIEQMDEEYDFIFIDTPGKLDINQSVDEQHITKVLMLLDYVFLPFKAGVLNLDATSDYVKMLLRLEEQRAKTDRPLGIFGMVNSYRQATRVNKHLDAEIDFLKKHTTLKFMRTRIRNYTAFEDINTVTSLFEMGNTGDRAKLNFSIFFKEFIKIIDNG